MRPSAHPFDDAKTRAVAWLTAWDSQGAHRTPTTGDEAGALPLAHEVAGLGVEVAAAAGPHKPFRGAALQLAPHHRFDVDLALMLAGLHEGVGHLKPQPRFGSTAESLVESDRHIRPNSVLAVYKIIEGPPGHVQLFRRLRVRKPSGSMLSCLVERLGWDGFFIVIAVPPIPYWRITHEVTACYSSPPRKRRERVACVKFSKLVMPPGAG